MSNPGPTAEGSPLVLPLSALGRGDLDRAGGKGANLGELVRAGFPVPAGFVVTTAAYDHFVARNDLDKTIAGALHEDDGAAIRASFKAAPIPPEVERALRRLADLGAAIERHFGRPQDVEWAWAGGALYILQARPITALPAPLPRPSRPLRLMAGLVAELLPARPYPLEATTWVPTVYSFLARFGALLGVAFLPLDQLFVEEDGVVVRLRGRLPVRPTPGILLAPLRLARRYDPAHWRADPLLPEAQARVRKLEARDLRAQSWDGPLATVREALAIPALIWEFRVRYLVRPMFAVGRLRLALALLGRADRFGTLLFTGVETRTLEANRALEGLAARIRSEPALADAFARREPDELWTALEAQPAGRAFLTELRAFLGAYGHREAGGTLQVDSRPGRTRRRWCSACCRGSPGRRRGPTRAPRGRPGKRRETKCSRTPSCGSRPGGPRSSGSWRRRATSRSSARTLGSISCSHCPRCGGRCWSSAGAWPGLACSTPPRTSSTSGWASSNE